MKTRIWKKICQRIKIINVKNGFEVQHRYFYRASRWYNNWVYLNSFDTYAGALHQKHLYIRNIMLKNLGFKNRYNNKFSK